MSYDGLIAQVEKFITDLHNGNIQILPKAQHLQLCTEEKNKFRLTRKTETIGTLAFLIGQAISSYEQNKANPFFRLKYAKILSEYIEWAYTHKVVKEVKLGIRIKELEQENDKLKKQIRRLRTFNNRLLKENKELHRFMDTKSGGSVISDV